MASASMVGAQTVQTLCSFNGTDGSGPLAGLTLGPDGNFYGTTYGGGTYDEGTVFKVTTNGALTSLVSFNGTNGRAPYAGLTLGNDGNFYGTTYVGTTVGNTNDYGTVFKVTTNGTLTSLVSFNAPIFNTNPGNIPPEYPQAALTLGNDGNFYGTTTQGGWSEGFTTYNYGAVFMVTTNGTLTTLVLFDCATLQCNGCTPRAALTLGPDGNFYGTTYFGGWYGNVFKVTTDGTLTNLVYFNNTNGANPQAALTLGPDGNFYGTTAYGGTNGNNGTVFKVTTTGTLTTLVSFDGTNGGSPQAALTLGPDGNFYGTTEYGGSGDGGTVFKITTNGTLTTLVSFNGANGANPNALTLGPDGNFYGTTSEGGSGGVGTVFRLILRAAPRLSNPQITSNSFSFNISGVPNNCWNVYTSSDLTNWGLVGGVTLDGSGDGSYTNASISGVPYLFYRLGNGE